jgi:hypothetical protein
MHASAQGMNRVTVSLLVVVDEIKGGVEWKKGNRYSGGGVSDDGFHLWVKRFVPKEQY